MNFERNRESFSEKTRTAATMNSFHETVHPSDESETKSNLDAEHWTQVFNTALITTRVESARSSGAELYSLLQSPAFNALLTSIKALASTEGSSELEAAKEMILLFRRLDETWTDLLMQEGFERLKGKN